jgi:hypothetical protein
MNVSFHMYFPNESDARRAAEALQGQGFEVETRLGVDEKDWLVVASGTVDENAFDAEEAKLEELARTFGGRFDGYEEEA